MSNKFQTDSKVHSELPKRKKQKDSRIAQLINFAKASGFRSTMLKSCTPRAVVLRGCSKKLLVRKSSGPDSVN